jgi:hypothetical protein
MIRTLKTCPTKFKFNVGSSNLLRVVCCRHLFRSFHTKHRAHNILKLPNWIHIIKHSTCIVLSNQPSPASYKKKTHSMILWAYLM